MTLISYVAIAMLVPSLTIAALILAGIARATAGPLLLACVAVSRKSMQRTVAAVRAVYAMGVRSFGPPSMQTPAARLSRF